MSKKISFRLNSNSPSSSSSLPPSFSSLSSSSSSSFPQERDNTNIFENGNRRSEPKRAVDIVPTFLLKGIDPVDLLKRYLNGDFFNMSIPNIKVTPPASIISADHVVGSGPEDEIYEYIDRTNTRTRVITSNHERYAIMRNSVQTNKKYSSTPSGMLGGICKNCRRQFKHESIGVPIRLEYFPEIDLIIFHVTGIYCTYECALEIVKLKVHCPALVREPLYMDSETMLRLMFLKTHPDKDAKIGSVPDWELLECNGGPLPEKNFFSKAHVYQSIPNMILLPVKLEYVRKLKD